MNDDEAVTEQLVRNTQGGQASWEEPYLPLAQRVRKHWRRMLVHLWGPAGSVVFHVAALGVLLTVATGTRKVWEELPATEIPVIHKDEPIEPKPDVTAQKDVKPPDPLVDNDQPNTDPGVSLAPPDAPGGSGTQPEGTGLGTGPSDLAAPSAMEIAYVKGRLIMPGLMAGRTPGGREGALAAYNKGGPGGKKTEEAVLKALRWLKREQQADGSWIGSKQNAPPAMTAMALLAYLARGEKTDSEEFGSTVKHGIQWLLANQESDGHFKGRDAHDYSQPIAAYALCEAYAMTGQMEVKEAAVKAVTLVVLGQHPSGGFNYNLDQSLRNDSSYMAWCCQALKAAKMARLQEDVPGLDAAIKKGIAGFKINADPNGGFGYERSGRTGLSGAGALCMQLLGAPKAVEVQNTMKFLDACTFSFATPDQQPYGGGSQVYYWYYITQAKFQHSEETFNAWNKLFSSELCRTQQVEKNMIADPKGAMVDIGHWESPVKGEHTGGLVQDTALCTLMLEVYYRYLPTFKHVDVEPDVLAASAKSEDVTGVKVR